jgi:hypothetical protein
MIRSYVQSNQNSALIPYVWDETISVETLKFIRPLPEAEDSWIRFARMKNSINDKGLLSPVYVYLDEYGYTLVDGYLRLAILSEIGVRDVKCRIMSSSPPRAQPARFTAHCIIEESVMLAHVIKRGTEVSKLSDLWSCPIDLIEDHAVLASGLAAKVKTLLKNTPIEKAALRLIRHMPVACQLEVAQAMHAKAVYSAFFAKHCVTLFSYEQRLRITHRQSETFSETEISTIAAQMTSVRDEFDNMSEQHMRARITLSLLIAETDELLCSAEIVKHLAKKQPMILGRLMNVSERRQNTLKRDLS